MMSLTKLGPSAGATSPRRSCPAARITSQAVRSVPAASSAAEQRQWGSPTPRSTRARASSGSSVTAADPRDGRALGRSFDPDNEQRRRRLRARPFRPPKSVSVLWGVGGEELRQQSLRRTNTPSAASLAFLEDHAAFTRRGAAGSSKSTPRALSQRASSTALRVPADPQLHTHVLVANKVRAEDGVAQPGRSRALRAPEGRPACSTRRRFAPSSPSGSGSTGPPSTTTARRRSRRAQGAPRALVGASARSEVVRRQLVANREAELGRRSRRTSAPGAPARRLSQPGPEDRRRDADRGVLVALADEAAACGQAPERWLSRVTGRRRPHPSAGEAAAELIARLEERTATWARSEVMEELAASSPGRTRSCSGSPQEAADEVLADAAVLGLLHRCRSRSRRRFAGGTAWHSTSVTAHRAIRPRRRFGGRPRPRGARGGDANAAVVPEAIADTVLDRSSLGEDQQERCAGWSVAASGSRSSSVPREPASPARSTRHAKHGTRPASVRSGSRPRRWRRRCCVTRRGCAPTRSRSSSSTPTADARRSSSTTGASSSSTRPAWLAPTTCEAAPSRGGA